MERKIGEIFTYNGKIYQVVKSILCTHCAFTGKLCGLIGPSAGNCMPNSRSDNTSVIFKEINNNMEIKNNQLTIDIPKGMEIDLENSDLAKGIIKFKEKKLCFNDILISLREKPSYSTYGLEVSACNAESLNALGQLMDIAKYYNGDWKPNWSDVTERKYFIVYNKSNDAYSVDYSTSSTYNNIYFSNMKNATSVIFNPKFKYILDAIYKN